MKKPYCYIDIDLTLVDIDLNLFPGAQDRLAELNKKYNLIAWSAGGGEYAREVLNRNQVSMYFIHFLDKPFVIVDDSPHAILEHATVVKIEKQSDWDKETFWTKLFHKPLGDLCTILKQ